MNTRGNREKPQILNSERVFTIGKYKGLHLNEVVRKDVHYVEWLAHKTPWAFTRFEIQSVRNEIHREKNKDILKVSDCERSYGEQRGYRFIQSLIVKRMIRRMGNEYEWQG